MASRIEKAKEAVKNIPGGGNSDSQFEKGTTQFQNQACTYLTFSQGHQVPVQTQDAPGLQSDLPEKPMSSKIPNEDGGFQIYKAAGKLEGKKAIITGGDSGIGRAIAILFAMEGADSLIAHLPQEESDAQETKRRVEEAGSKCHLLAVDLKEKENCIKVVETALEKMGGINILCNNAAYQMMVEEIKDLPE